VVCFPSFPKQNFSTQITAILRFLTMLSANSEVQALVFFYIILQLPKEGAAEETIYWQSPTSAERGLNTAVVTD
jgi:hypothetical protein